MIFPGSLISHLELWERVRFHMCRDMSMQPSLTLDISRLLVANCV
jgi:hypothetical protein